MARKSKGLRVKANKAASILTVIAVAGIVGFLLRWPMVADAVAKMIGRPDLSGEISMWADTVTGMSVAVLLMYLGYLTLGNPMLALMVAGLGLITAYFTLKKFL